MSWPVLADANVVQQTKARCHWEARHSYSSDSGVVAEAGVTNSADWWPEVGRHNFFLLFFTFICISFLGGHHARLQLCLLQLPRAQHGAGLWLDPLRWDDTGLTILPLNICIFMVSDALGGQQRANAGFPRGGGQNDQRHCHWRGEASTSFLLAPILRYSAPV